MKKLISPLVLLTFIQFPGSSPVFQSTSKPLTPSENLFIIILDGFRWQEVFTGADSLLINNEKYTPDTNTTKLMYWANTPGDRRKKLLPFFWNVLSVKGQILGNRLYENKVNVANIYSISYPGYHEIFTGNSDPAISSNQKKANPYVNVLEFLNSKPAFDERIAAFTSWDVFPFILNKWRNNLKINSGYAEITDESPSITQTILNHLQQETIQKKKPTRFDQITFLAAKEHVHKYQPRILFLSLGETDEHAHDGRYDLYLEKANQADKMIAELWNYVQTTPGYKNNTHFIITTDHGRGSGFKKWKSHGSFITGSSETWLALIGPGVDSIGEVKDKGQLYQVQLAQTIAELVGERFISRNKIAPAVSLR